VLVLERLAQIALARGSKAETTGLAGRARPLGRASWLAPHLAIRIGAVVVQAAASHDDAVDAVRAADRTMSASTCHVC
jgi:hypothetical protein